MLQPLNASVYQLTFTNKCFTVILYMGRIPPGANRQLEISSLIEDRIIIDGKKTKGKIRESTYPELRYTTDLRDPDNRIINLEYKVYEETPVIKAEIKIRSLRTNFKNGGKTLYLICPISGNPTKKLCLCNCTHQFVHYDTYRKMYEHNPRGYPLINTQTVELFKAQTIQAIEDRHQRSIVNAKILMEQLQRNKSNL